jgi:hypothetical protein
MPQSSAKDEFYSAVNDVTLNSNRETQRVSKNREKRVDDRVRA